MARIYRKQSRAADHAGESDCKYTRLARRIGLVTLAFVLQLSSSTSSASSSSSSVQAAAYSINVDDVHELLPAGVTPTAAGGRKALSLYYYNGRMRPAQNSWVDDVQQLQLVANTFALRHRHSYTQNGDHKIVQGSRRRELLTGLLSNRPLAVRSDRIDPLNHFRHYRGGFDVNNKHYWASVAFTGIAGYAIGVAWLLVGLLLALFLCCKYCCKCCCGCCRRPKSDIPHSGFYYWLPRILVLLLSLIALGSLVTLFVRNKQLTKQVHLVEGTILGAATSATTVVGDITSTLARVDGLLASYDVPGLSSLNSTDQSLNNQAASVNSTVNSTKRKLDRLVKDVEIALIVILAVTIFIVLAGLAATFFGWRRIFYLIIVAAWLLTALIWILFGVCYAFNNVVSDTCLAVDEYLQAPANTTLDNILPCVDLATAGNAFVYAREGISNIILEANSTVASIELYNSKHGNGNSSLGGVCDPLGGAPNYTYTGTCQPDTIPIGNIPQVIAPYVCMSNMTAFECLSEGRFVTQGTNATLYALSNGAQSLLNILPEMENLANCSFVYATFTTFVNQRCDPLKSVFRNLWIPMVILSTAMTLLCICWMLALHRNLHQRYLGTIHARDYSPTKTAPPKNELEMT